MKYLVIVRCDGIQGSAAANSFASLPEVLERGLDVFDGIYGPLHKGATFGVPALLSAAEELHASVKYAPLGGCHYLGRGEQDEVSVRSALGRVAMSAADVRRTI